MGAPINEYEFVFKEEEGAYCLANVGRLVGWSVGRSVRQSVCPSICPSVGETNGFRSLS